MDSEQAPKETSTRLVIQPDGRILSEPTSDPPDVPPEGAPVELAYLIREDDARKAPVIATLHHLVYSIRLLPGRSLTFHVPLSYFKKRYDILMDFNYEWEFDKNGGSRGGVKVFHQVYFFNEDLPEAALQRGHH